MRRLFMAIGTVLVAVFLCVGSARAQGVPCGPEDPASNLFELHKETPRVVGMTGRGALMTIYASEKGSWSLIIFLPRQHMFCMVDSGETIEILPPPKSKKK